ncbi:MAG: PRC-barrel domain-containing protein [Candidatus Hodarchaeales archaeon]|jgi:ribosomal 30S subunit maturation factor RimM
MIKSGKDYFFSVLTKFKVLDSENKSLGRIGDALFSKDLSLDSLILFGSIIEEKMEDIGLREDIDPIISVKDIVEEDIKGKKLKITKLKTQIPTTGKDWKPPEDLYQFTKLRKIPVYDKNEEKIGTIIDIAFHTDGTYTLVIGGSFLEEFLERIKIFADKDLLVPKKYIKEFSMEKIIVFHAKMELSTTIDEKINPDQIFADHKIGFVPRGYANIYPVR